jgi:hypothetical protein
MDVTINIGMMPEGKKLRSQKNPMVDDMDAEEQQTDDAPEQDSVKSETMYIGVDGITNTKPVPKMGKIANKKSKPEVLMGLE